MISIPTICKVVTEAPIKRVPLSQDFLFATITIPSPIPPFHLPFHHLFAHPTMKERQASLPKQEDLQNPTRRLTRSSSRQTQRLITTDLPLVPPRTTTTASNTPGTTGQKRSAAEQ
jgi:hypothetical protein